MSEKNAVRMMTPIMIPASLKQEDANRVLAPFEWLCEET